MLNMLVPLAAAAAGYVVGRMTGGNKVGVGAEYPSTPAPIQFGMVRDYGAYGAPRRPLSYGQEVDLGERVEFSAVPYGVALVDDATGTPSLRPGAFPQRPAVQRPMMRGGLLGRTDRNAGRRTY